MTEAHLPEHMNALLIGGGVLDEKGSDLLAHGVAMTGIEGSPRVLHIPTAKPTPGRHGEYAERLAYAYRQLGVTDFSTLHPFMFKRPFHETTLDEAIVPSAEEMRESVEAADLLFVAGGNTRAMIDTWKQTGVLAAIQRHIANGKIVSGISAGAIAWFSYGHSDYESYDLPPGTSYGDSGWSYRSLPGLNLIEGYAIPHFDDKTTDDAAMREEVATHDFEETASLGHVAFGIGLDNYVALETYQGSVSVVSSSSEQTASNRKAAYVLSYQEGRTQTIQIDTADGVSYTELINSHL